MSKSLFILPLFLLSLCACRPLHPVITPTSTSSLSPQTLRNGSYNVLLPDHTTITIPLTDGAYQSGQDPSQPGFLTARLGDHIALGDLNGDGLEDAVLTLALNLGGTGTRTAILPILNRDGTAWQPFPVPLEDLPILHTLTIEDGKIFLSATVHGVNDANCCPSLLVTRTYRLLPNELWLTHLASRVSADAVERLIRIQTPADGAEVTCQITSTGNVTIAPFENTLVYRVLTAAGEEIEQGPLMVDAPDMGLPGTFTLTLDLCQQDYRGPIRLEFWDFSPADGSPLAMEAVSLLLR